MHTIEIRKAGLADLEALQQIGRKTFYEAFAEVNTVEDMQMYLDNSFGTNRLTQELTDPGSEFYFALVENKVIGYLKINHCEAQTDLKDKKAIEIERIYVLRDFHGKKVAQALYDTALQVAAQAGSEYVWLGVWEKNPRAISFYKKNGFIEFGTHMFKLGNDEQQDILMRLSLK